MAKFNEKGFIVKLDPHEVIVVGTNLEGRHAGGAAKQAYEDFGAVWGIGVGRQGQSYAIPTMPPLTLKEIGHYIREFVEYARLHRDIEFLVTPIGTGIAGFTETQMETVWPKILPDNITRLL